MKRPHDTDDPCSSKKAAQTNNHDSSEKDLLDKKSHARHNWKILSVKLRKALTSSHQSFNSSLGLFSFKNFTVSYNHQTSFNIKLPDDFFKTNSSRLNGFDNTGNCRLWPGGEALAAYIIDEKISLKSSVLELGSGMLALPSLAASKFSTKVFATDGNQHSINTVKSVVQLNNMENISAFTYKWGEKQASFEENKTFDTILACDCIFFPESYENLLRTFDMFLSKISGAFILVCAPNRKGSLARFLEFIENLKSTWAATLDIGFENYIKGITTKIHVPSDEYPQLCVISRSNSDLGAQENAKDVNFDKEIVNEKV